MVRLMLAHLGLLWGLQVAAVALLLRFPLPAPVAGWAALSLVGAVALVTALLTRRLARGGPAWTAGPPTGAMLVLTLLAGLPLLLAGWALPPETWASFPGTAAFPFGAGVGLMAVGAVAAVGAVVAARSRPANRSGGTTPAVDPGTDASVDAGARTSPPAAADGTAPQWQPVLRAAEVMARAEDRRQRRRRTR